MVNTQPGLWQTRTNRLVRIKSFRWTEQTSAVAGEPPLKVRIWQGDMFKADGKTLDSQHEWNDHGNFFNPRGVVNPHDLTLLIRADPPAADAAEPETKSAPAAVAK
jgi:hypothetical protein